MSSMDAHKTKNYKCFKRSCARFSLTFLSAFIISCVPAALVQNSEEVDGNKSSLILAAEVFSETKVKLTWDPGIGVYSAYQFFQVFGPTEVGVANAGANEREIVIDVGEAPGNNLTFRVRATRPGMDSILGDSATAQVKMPLVTVAWQLIQAAGPSPGSTTKIVYNAGLEADEAFIHLRWKNTSSHSIALWKVFRSESATGTSINDEPLLTSTSTTFLDQDNMTPGKRYYYLVAGYDNLGKVLTLSRETYVRVPPEHQILVHRESANFEMCELLTSEIDPKNFNRCSFSGLGSNGAGFYDFGKLLFVDRYELGVNHTMRPGACGDNTWGCSKYPYLSKAGSAAAISPAEYLNDDSLLQEGEVMWANYFTNFAGQWTGQAGAAGVVKIKNPLNPTELCMAGIQHSTAVQCHNSAGTLTTLPTNSVDFVNGIPGEYDKAFTNAPKKIPLTLTANGGSGGVFGLEKNIGACSKRLTDNFGASRVPLRSEQVVYSAWGKPGERLEPAGLTPQILESGQDHFYAGACATQMTSVTGQPGLGNTVNGLDFRAGGALAGTNVYPLGDLIRRASDEQTPAGYGLGNPWPLNTNFMALITGSSLTKNCVSRYGVQDHIGNLSEIVDIRFNPGSSSTTAEGDGEIAGYIMDGVLAPGGGAPISLNGPNGLTMRSKTCLNLTSTPFVGETTKPFTHFLPTLGLPYLSAEQGALLLGNGATGTFKLSSLMEDSFCVVGENAVGHSPINKFAFTGGSAGRNQYGDLLVGSNGANPTDNTSGVIGNATLAGRGRWTLAYSNLIGATSYMTGIRCITEDN
jgi:hypothetical protein